MVGSFTTMEECIYSWYFMMLKPTTRNLKLRNANDITSAQPTLLFIDCAGFGLLS